MVVLDSTGEVIDLTTSKTLITGEEKACWYLGRRSLSGPNIQTINDRASQETGARVRHFKHTSYIPLKPINLAIMTTIDISIIHRPFILHGKIPIAVIGSPFSILDGPKPLTSGQTIDSNSILYQSSMKN